MEKKRLAYQDSWVVDRTLFEYVNQGSCSCCGVSHAVIDAARFFELCSDMETDDQRRQRNSPWPPFMRDELWRDMVVIRTKMKATLPEYQEFVAKELPRFSAWWDEVPPRERKKVFQMPIEEVKITYHVTFDVKKAYSTLSCSLLEQVKRFRETGLPPDGRTEWEIDFEDVLEVERGAFVVHREYVESEEGVRSFLGMMAQAGGPKLLPRRDKTMLEEQDGAALLSPDRRGLAGVEEEESSDDEGGGSDDEEEEKDEEEQEPVEADGPSFRSDRRLMRLVIFRYFADRAIRRYRAFLAEQERGSTPACSVRPPEAASAAATAGVSAAATTGHAAAPGMDGRLGGGKHETFP